MSLEPSACEDLKAFERRLTEVIAAIQPSTLRWRILLGTMSLVTFVGAFYWLTDPRTSIVPLVDSLWNHPVFTVSTAILLLLFVLGIHKLVIAPQIITSRTRSVLAEFNMSCDETGKLILRPRPTNNSRYMDMSLNAARSLSLPFCSSSENPQ
ncbi:nuclear envelope phosphatase-regulatory subunit 1 homolog isoform X2 [Uranotaenia lowii]|uniref:nuclear envelope phosphatase-regulatory subunit 1 homolog isoform X2 n=1 Tax=Uranotaenia lowii TaxID=190385 RepID=UPI00247B0E0E|nr:nuclear envelope phosphatase-regulatory subunit 1 homolog isoform X2 [Uranotaenia lowii]